MAINEIPKSPSTSGTGISTISDLYNLINGTNTSTSGQTVTDTGGRTVTTESSGLDQAGMNAMLKQILESSSGLAAVSSGQRSAGGYGSSTNSLLTNDLLTRSAAQVAANNRLTTKIVDTPTTTRTISGEKKTTGGLTADGLIRSAITLAGTKYGKKALGIFDNNSQSDSISNVSTGDFARADGASYRSDQVESTNLLDPIGSTYTGIVDFNDIGSPSTSIDIPADIPTDIPADIPADVELPEIDYGAFFADGGLVKKKASALTTSQYGRASSSDLGSNIQASIGRDYTGSSSPTSATSATSTSDASASNSGTGEAVNSGTPGEGGFGLSSGMASALGMGLSVAGLHGAGSIVGLGNSSTPSQALSAVSMAILGAISPPAALAVALGKALIGTNSDSTPDAPNSVDAATGIEGFNNQGLAGMGISLGLDGPDGTPGAEGGGLSGAGNSAGSGVGTGANGDSAVSAAFGGKIEGRGTGTSDSINAKLSDGETIITAKTTSKVRELFGADFFNNLESMFNAPAAEKQRQLDRV
jgi:hypothetical protein